MAYRDTPTNQEALELAARELAEGDIREGYGDERPSIEIGPDGTISLPGRIGKIAAAGSVTGRINDGYGNQPDLIETQWGLTRTDQISPEMLDQIQQREAQRQKGNS